MNKERAARNGGQGEVVSELLGAEDDENEVSVTERFGRTKGNLGFSHGQQSSIQRRPQDYS